MSEYYLNKQWCLPFPFYLISVTFFSPFFFNKLQFRRVFSSVQFISVAQSCLALCDPMDCCSPGFSVHPSPTPRAYSNSCPLNRWFHPTTSSLLLLFSSCLQSFPASGSFPVSQFYASGDKNIGVSASASVLPMNIQDWSPLGWTSWISLQSKGLSRVFSNTTVQKHQFFSTQLSLWSDSHIHTDYWKNHDFDYTDLCWQTNVSAFGFRELLWC